VGLRDRFNKAASKALTSAVLGEPYTGDTHPRGTHGALAIPGELEVELPPGKIKFVYHCKGKPAGWEGGDGTWELPGIEFECMPAEGSSANRLQDLRVPDMPMQKVAAFGSSHKTMFVGEVPEPGGRYLAKVEQPVYDDEAHIRFVG
jgi:hypothetical protein